MKNNRTDPETNRPLFSVVALRGDHFGPISVKLDVRECVVVTGPSGSGKSLFLRALADLDPNEGDIRLGSTLRQDFAPAQWRRRVGLLPAESHWWASTVGEHFPAYDGMQMFSELGFERGVLDWSVARLSSGERQRLALLRVLANQPRVLLLDEPTANLDKTNVRRVETLINGYVGDNNACVLWVTHSKSQARRVADRVVQFSAGRLDLGLDNGHD